MNDREVEARTEVDLELVSEAGAKEVPVPGIGSRGVSSLYFADLSTIQQFPQASLIN
jgi:hypothetical protein